MNRNLLTLFDLDKKSFLSILDISDQYKKKTIDERFLNNKNIGLIFEKPSTRTRVSTEVAIYQSGGNPIYLSSSELQLNRGESIEDTARVLSRYLDAVIIRSRSHSLLERFAAVADIPVINALSDQAHPLQILADFMTIRENGIDLNKFNLCFLGDGQNNVIRSLMSAFTFFHGKLSIGTHQDYNPDEGYLDIIRKAGATVEVFNLAHEAARNADVLYTDVWVSMGSESEANERRSKLKNFQINSELMNIIGKPPILLHCLPAIKGEEISEDAFNSINSRIFDQAENRLHTMKAVLRYILTDK